MSRRQGTIATACVSLLLCLSTASQPKPIDSKTAYEAASNWTAANLFPWTVPSGTANRGTATARPFREPKGTTIAYCIDLYPKGFVVVSADDTIEPVIAFSKDSYFNDELTRNNVLADMLIQDIPHRLSRAAGREKSAAVAERWLRLTNPAGSTWRRVRSAEEDIYGPLILDRWDQFSPYNYYIPNDWPTGCVATAMGMIIHYFEYPSAASGANVIWLGIDQYPLFASFDDTFNYDAMPASLDGGSTAAQVIEVAKLIRNCGISVGMWYSPNGSGASPANLPNAYKLFFGYSSADLVSSTWYAPDIWSRTYRSILESEIAEGYPVQVGISSATQTVRHSVVCDGRMTLYGDEYYHLNMGWGNVDSTNAWYMLPTFEAIGYRFDLVTDLAYNLRTGDDQRVANPSFAPDSGWFSAPSPVRVTCGTAGATIRYTTDGTEPNQSSSSISNGGSINVQQDTLLFARAFKKGFRHSDIKRAVYLFEGAVSTPAFSPTGGTFYSPVTVIVSCQTEGAVIRYTSDGREPTQSDPVIVSGDSLHIDKTATLKAKAWKTGLTSSDVATDNYTLKVQTPTMFPSGGKFSEWEPVTATCGTTDAEMHYTMDGGDPTQLDPAISSAAAIVVDGPMVLKVKAWKANWEPSSVAQAAFAFDGTILKGIAMVGVPIIPDETDPKLVIPFQANRWYAYKPSSRSYAVYPDGATWFEPASATPGRGFWARFDHPVVVPIGTVPNQEEAVTVHLTPGWNLVGNPFQLPMVWDWSRIRVRAVGGAETFLGESQHLVSPYAWCWRQNDDNPYQGIYQVLCDQSYIVVGTGTLDPWAACWVKAKRECDLILPPAYSYEPPPPPPFSQAASRLIH